LEPAHWLPNPFCPPQSGQVQVIALQDMPHMFSCIHSWQILNPQRQVQQNVNVIRQQTQSLDLRRRCRLRETDFVAGTFMIVVLNL
ncbi:MAG: hypothetical protein PVG17_17000, partial [Desulfobacterales bacterium]